MSDDGCVYLAQFCEGYDQVTVVGVYTSRDAAIDCLRRRRNEDMRRRYYRPDRYYYDVERVALDCDIDPSRPDVVWQADLTWKEGGDE